MTRIFLHFRPPAGAGRRAGGHTSLSFPLQKAKKVYTRCKKVKKCKQKTKSCKNSGKNTGKQKRQRPRKGQVCGNWPARGIYQFFTCFFFTFLTCYAYVKHVYTLIHIQRLSSQGTVDLCRASRTQGILALHADVGGLPPRSFISRSILGKGDAQIKLLQGLPPAQPTTTAS